jgi:hypothetical protein
VTEAEELAKARLHNQQAVNRRAYRRDLRMRLSGDPAAAQAVRDGMSAPLKAAQERRDDCE